MVTGVESKGRGWHASLSDVFIWMNAWQITGAATYAVRANTPVRTTVHCSVVTHGIALYLAEAQTLVC